VQVLPVTESAGRASTCVANAFDFKGSQKMERGYAGGGAGIGGVGKNSGTPDLVWDDCG